MMIVMIITIACSLLMEPLIVAPAYPGNKQVDHVDLHHVVETPTLDIINNVILRATVDLELVNKNKPRNQSLNQKQNQPLVKPQMIVILLVIAYGTPMGLQTVVHVSLGYKPEDHAVVIWTRSIKNNVIPPVNVDILMAIAHCLESVI
jgi:hypothetical protein